LRVSAFCVALHFREFACGLVAVAWNKSGIGCRSKVENCGALLGGGYIATLEIPISILLLTWGCQLCQRTTFPYNRSFASVGPQGPAYFVTRRKIILNSREFSVSVAIVRPEFDRNPPNFCRSLLPHDDHVPSSCWISSTWSCHAVAAVLWVWYSSN
jgi:hypothetical protein